ncbi:restriction endonuclease subunit S [uncultured Cohaesibacter sp.]|uniref:restriction endonuclease subunit S n=1 Tax=uncultured Cohaesibacter sp. TaxID=1002546 RepID=UPI002AA7B935|nr:restriction endonuclease subunit S [uncultured Cohaesibacter sp.]
MNAERLLELYDNISEAPNAVDRLRRFVLDLAVRGKLVEQDVGDEPASRLVSKLALEKKRLIDNRQIKKPNSTHPIAPCERPIECPSHWNWLRLTDIGRLSGGMTPSKTKHEYWDGSIVWLSPKDIKSDEIDTSELKITEQGLNDTRLELYPAGSLFIVARSGILKRTFPVSINRVPAASNQDLKVLTPYVNGLERYLQIMFRGMTDFLLRDLVKTGTTVQSLKYAEFEKQAFPLPPLAEQHRIVSKVDELMALCDRLEEARKEREETRDRLTRASLARLTAPETTEEEFPAHAAFALSALPALTTRPHQIKSLRQTILNLAVRGKLVEQDPANGSGAALAHCIASDKAAKTKAGLIKPAKAPKGATLNSGLEFPDHWQALLMVDILDELQTGPFGSSLKKSDYVVNGVPVINPASIVNEAIHPVTEMAVSQKTLERLASFKLQQGDIVMARRGEMGRCALVSDTEAGWLCGTGSLILRPSQLLFARYLVLLIGSPYSRSYLTGSAVGATMQNLNQNILLSMPIGLPPEPEQRRIVAKVDELMALCDQLEAALTKTDTTRTRLLDALLHEALEPSSNNKEAAE